MSANRFFSLLVVMALMLVVTLTVREAVATSAVLSEVQKAERAQAADAARWTAMGEYYQGFDVARRERSLAAETARWTAIGAYYSDLAEAQLQLSRAADAARWTAMSEYYKHQKANLSLGRGRAADAARWTAMAEYYKLLDTTK